MKENENLFYYIFYREKFFLTFFHEWKFTWKCRIICSTPLCIFKRIAVNFSLFECVFFPKNTWTLKLIIHLRKEQMCLRDVLEMRHFSLTTTPLRSSSVVWISAFAVHNSLVCLFHLFTFNIFYEYSCMCKYFTSVACAPNGLEGYLWAFICDA